MLGKHSEEGQTIKRLQETITLKDKEITDIKRECADQFKKIRDLCFANEYGGKNDKSAKLRKIYEIAADNFSAIIEDLVISDSTDIAKIIELPTNRKVSK